MDFKQFELKGTALSKLVEMRQKQARGEIRAVQSAWPEFDKLIGGGLRAGEVSVLAGPGGNGKSNFSLNLIVKMAAMGRPALYMPLEDEAWEIMGRICAIIAGDWSLLNEPKTEEEFQIQLEKIASHEQNTPLCAAIDSHYIMKNPKEAVIVNGKVYAPKLPPEDVLDWLNSDMCSDKELIVIDPISQINFSCGQKAFFEAQEEFIQHLHAYAKHKRIHIMLLAHIRKRQYHGGKFARLTVDDIQGSAAFNRHTRYVFMLDYNPIGFESVVDGTVTRDVIHRHKLQIEKCNFGEGTGADLAFKYAQGGPQFQMIGRIDRRA